MFLQMLGKDHLSLVFWVADDSRAPGSFAFFADTIGSGLHGFSDSIVDPDCHRFKSCILFLGC